MRTRKGKSLKRYPARLTISPKMKGATLFFLLIFLVPISFAEIVVQTLGSSALVTPEAASTHSFIVNKYYPAGAGTPVYSEEISIMVEQLEYEATTAVCGKANFSFKITNPSNRQQLYTFEMKDFIGTAYITPNLMLSPKDSRIIHYTLLPDCSEYGQLNPKVIIRAENSNQEAIVPTILNIEGIPITEDDCQYYFNQTICSSDYYLSFYSDSSQNIDLSRWFYDPDSDKLVFSASDSSNLKILITDNLAEIKPRRGWSGAETVVFYANDGRGGFAESREFYIHVLRAEGNFITRFFFRMFGL